MEAADRKQAHRSLQNFIARILSSRLGGSCTGISRVHGGRARTQNQSFDPSKGLDRRLEHDFLPPPIHSTIRVARGHRIDPKGGIEAVHHESLT
jgi:hypothetical protein